MRKHLRKILAWAACLVLALTACCAGAEEEAAPELLGKPFPDFTVTDTEGNTFTLSKALEDHEAVLINFWATWCGPCQAEFPLLNEVYKKYGDRVAFIALSVEGNDTLETIAAFRGENGITFPMGRDENQALFGLTASQGIPTTVVVDRFGNAVFCHTGAFWSAEEPERVLKAFLGDGYTETKAIGEVPRDTETQAFPVSKARAVYPENGNYRTVVFSGGDYPVAFTGYIVPEDTIRLRIEIAADDNVSTMAYLDPVGGVFKDVKSLLDKERSVYVYDQAMPEQFAYVTLGDMEADEDLEKLVNVFLLRSEECIPDVLALLGDEDGPEMHWEYAEESEKENSLEAYIVHVADQDGNPVEEVMVNFCTDTACVPMESDKNGLISFTGEPDRYHVVIVDAPEGYSWDEDFEMYTPKEYCEWILRVRKD